MTAAQLRHFKRITLDYFGKVAENEPAPELTDPFLQFGTPIVLDYTSIVRISGEYEGCIYMTSDMATLKALLRMHGEEEISVRTLLDMSREMSNVLAGSATRSLGDSWSISVPRSLTQGDFKQLDLPSATFVMPINWNSRKSYLVIGFVKPAKAAPPRNADTGSFPR